MAKQQNVQQQNAATRATIEQVAAEFAARPASLSWLVSLLTAHGINPDSGILVRLDPIPDQGGTQYSGLWLTEAREFFRFEAIVPYDEGGIVEIEQFENVTALTATHAHLRGTGKSFGYLALQVLRDKLTTPQRSAAHAWVEAANVRDVDRLVGLSSPDIEIVGPRGSVRGTDALRDWLSRAGLTLTTERTFARGSTVVIAQHGIWRSAETGAIMGEAEVASRFEVIAGRVTRYERFDNLPLALAAAGLSSESDLLLNG